MKRRVTNGKSTPASTSSANPKPIGAARWRSGPALPHQRSTERGFVSEWSVTPRRPIVIRAQGSITVRAPSHHPGQPVTASAVQRIPRSSPDSKTSPGRNRKFTATFGRRPPVTPPKRPESDAPRATDDDSTRTPVIAAATRGPGGGGGVGGTGGAVAITAGVGGSTRGG